MSFIPIKLYRVPVVLVHGIWTNSYYSWVYTNFSKTLEKNNFNVSLADYGKYNATTFDPFNITKIGNHGIDSIRIIAKDVLKKYNDKGIAASQVDIVAHSIGGLMARGFTQQLDYKNENNSMKGYIHRLITIGTPHFGAQLAKILYDNRNNYYCYKWLGFELYITTKNTCKENQNLPLKDIYKRPPAPFFFPFEEGGLQALVPNSKAYQNLSKTIIPSYAIIGNWIPEAENSHKFLENFYKNITRNSSFTLEGKEGFGEDNDLQVNITSQSGGLLDNLKCNTDNTGPYTASKIYPNTIHGSVFVHNDTNVTSELNSPQIRKDVISLLNSSNDRFSPTIGDTAFCDMKKYQ